MSRWKATKYPGVRYREHSTRKHGVQFDKYFSVRYTLEGNRHEEAIGWASDGWTVQSAAEELARLKRAHRTGEGAHSLAERRKNESARRLEKDRAKIEQEIASIVYDSVWEKYFLNAQNEKSFKAWDSEKHLHKKWIQPIIGKIPLRKVAPFHLEKIKKVMMDMGRAPKSVEYALAVVRQVFRYAKEYGIFEGIDPVSKVKIPRADNRRIRFLTYHEAEILLSKLIESSQDMHDMSLLALHCGPRAGEMFGLTWQDIDLIQGLVTFRDTKNKYVRHIPMTDRVRDMFVNRQAYMESVIVFPSRNGNKRRYVSHTFERTVKHLKWNEGIEDRRQKVVFHTLRHTCASWLVMAGVPLYTVKEYLGHRQISQTERYAHLAPESLKQATNALNNIGSEKPEQKTLVNLKAEGDLKQRNL